MPGFNGRGPAGAGPMTGRALGVCSGVRPAGLGYGLGRGGGGYGPGFGRGMGFGLGRGLGYGRGMGWFSVGYGEPGEGAVTNIRSALEERTAFLRAELERTEALLKSAQSGADGAVEGTGK